VAQQQLLILVFIVIIVGVAILDGIDRAEDGVREANKDNVMQELLILAGRAQAWRRMPTPLGGGGGSFEKLNLTAIHFDSVTHSGEFVLSNIEKESFRVTGIGNAGFTLMVTLEAFADSVVILQMVQ